jgi:hypothetical protein
VDADDSARNSASAVARNLMECLPWLGSFADRLSIGFRMN